MTDRPLSLEERGTITSLMKAGLKRIGADRASAPDPDKLQELVSQAIDQFREVDELQRQEALFDTSIILGSLWGQVICDQIGWTWVFIKLTSEIECYGVVSPNRAYVLFPMHHIEDLLTDTMCEQNSLTLYEAIKVGELPPSNDRAYLLLGAGVKE